MSYRKQAGMGGFLERQRPYPPSSALSNVSLKASEGETRICVL